MAVDQGLNPANKKILTWFYQIQAWQEFQIWYHDFRGKLWSNTIPPEFKRWHISLVFPTGNLSGSTTSFSLSNLSIESAKPNANTPRVVCGDNISKIATHFPIYSVAIYNLSGAKIDSFSGNGMQELQENWVAPSGVYIVVHNTKVYVKIINKIKVGQNQCHKSILFLFNNLYIKRHFSISWWNKV